MSIINEALRKAQKDKGSSSALKAGGAVAGPPLARFGVEYEQKKSKVNWGPVFILSVLVLITAPIIAPIFSTPFKNEFRLFSYETSAVTKQIHGPDAALSRKSQFTIEEAPRPFFEPVVPRPALELTGVVFSPNEDSYCIINGKVLKAGDKIQGVELVRITPRDVTMEYQGEKFVLSPTA